jgi:thiol-disulfide isomerase/thioredoxin
VSHLPSFDGATGWLNSPLLDADALSGRVVLVDFWTYTCINWLRTLPYVRGWHEAYAGRGLVVVGVHTPEFPFESDVDNVRCAVGELAVPYPVALDPAYAVWDAFANRYWPAVYIADAEGRIVHQQFGEGGYDKCERVIQQLLNVSGELVSVSPGGIEAQADWSNLESPETYLGSQQVERFAASSDGLKLNHWALSGDWAVESRVCVSKEAGARIVFRFHARDVNLVLAPAMPGTPVPFRVVLDGGVPGDAHGVDVDERGEGTLVEPRLYQLIRDSGRNGDRTFEIAFDAPGVEAYVFTFG